MAFDKKTRNELGKMVAECRRLLTDDVRDQFQRVYGIQPDGSSLDINKLKLDDRGREIAVSLRQWLDHLAAGETGTEHERRKAAFDRISNETAFTYVNRLAALRMCEERELVIECVRKGLTSDGFQLYERLAGQGLGDRGQTYRIFLECLFDELAVDLGVLFDRQAVHSLVFPSAECIEKVLEQLNSDDFKPLWKLDETIGWVYQFFNSDKERTELRKKSAAPRNSRELAVRNQFFTPRYVVQFLTDNTLGCIWYEMRMGQTRLLDQMDYFVRHDREVFLPEGQLPVASSAEQQDLTKEQLLQQEVQLAYRAKKDPRDIKVLDPAGGSGHFLLYAFDLLETIYEEAWADEASPVSKVKGTRLRDDYATLAELHIAVPELILRHNLYGIDIDQRACQIAALALWLRAQRRFKALRLKADDPKRRITKTNIVCAEPMPGEEDFLAEFAAKLDPPILGTLTKAIFEAMKLAGEAGSLLKIEDEIRTPLAEARRQWEMQEERAHDKKGRKLLFTVGQMDEAEKNPQPMLPLSGITDEEFWTTAEPTLLAELQKYAAVAANGDRVQRSLFAEDAEQGFAFVDLCRQRYDVVLMNPPFGDASLPSKPYIDDHYGDTKGDVFKAFVEAFQERLVPNGLLGIISSRSGFFKRDSKDWREQVVLRYYRPLVIADLGYFVLDAKVETAAYVLRGLRNEEREQVAISLLEQVNSLIAEAGSPFSVARYRDHRSLKRHQAEYELELLAQRGFLRFVPGHFPQYTHIRETIAAAQPAVVPHYPPMLCFRLLMETEKEHNLLNCIQNKTDHRSFVAQPSRFNDIPYHSFAYWLNPSYRRAFVDRVQFDDQDRTVKQGLATADDPRFVRAWWEVPATSVCPPDKHSEQYSGPYCVVGNYRWFPFSKGGKFSPFYGEIPHVINWHLNGSELRSFSRSVIRNPDYYFRPGLTYLSRTTVRTCAMPLPAGSVFGHTGPGIFVATEFLPVALARFNTFVIDGFLSVSHGQDVEPMSHRKQYEVGIMQRVPWSECCDERIEDLVRQAHRHILAIRSVDEISRFFTGKPSNSETHLDYAVDVLWQIDEVVAKDYKVDVHDLLMKGADRDAKHASAKQGMRKSLKLAGGFPDKKTACHNQISYALGCAFGRWDVRFALGKRPLPDVPDAFSPLPICPPGMLTADGGLPAIATPVDYPLSQIAWDGILVDDPGLDGVHPKPNDIVECVRTVWRLLHGDGAEQVEQELCTTLKVENLRAYFCSANEFFERHRKAYRKGGRDAPIYLPLATKSGLYSLWIYYPRLTDQTLYTAVNKYVGPKIDEVNRRIVQIDEELAMKSGREAADLRIDREKLQSFVTELEAFRVELLRVAGLPYQPDLNDGVLICAAPLSAIIPHNAWAKKLQEVWKKLSDGDLDWAHLAFSIWPDRVRQTAAGDLSIAIAHGLATGEELNEVEAVADDAVADESLDDLDDDEEGDDDE
ncbi:MAG: DNA methyltransferase [Planctomycetaceae bacterium]